MKEKWGRTKEGKSLVSSLNVLVDVSAILGSRGIKMYWQNLLNETMGRFNNLSKGTPDTFKGFSVMGVAAKTAGHLDEKTKEFIALGIAISTKCESCIGFHAKSLVRLGATREQLIEALAMVSYMGGGPAISYSAKALEAFDEFSQ